jgi:hypothetical protein
MKKTDDSIVEAFIRVGSLQRGLHEMAVRSLLGDFLECLHESQFKSGYRTQDGGVLNQVYWSLGEKSAYHFCELLSNGGQGHDAGTVRISLEYQDSHAKRFGTTVERWQMECDSEMTNE